MALARWSSQPWREVNAFEEVECAPPAARAVIDDLEGCDLEELSAEIRRELQGRGVVFHSAEGDSDFLVDPVPRLIDGEEWERLEAGVAQRVAALERFVADVYGARRASADGVLPQRVIDRASYHEPGVLGAAPACWIGVAGLDIVRDGDGAFRVLEDNVRTPSGMAYAMAAREVVSRRVGVPDGISLRPLQAGPGLLAAALAAASPAGVSEPLCVLLSDGPQNSAFYEHEQLAGRLEIALLAPDALVRRGPRLYLRGDGRAVDVVYRRTDEDRMHAPDGSLTALGELIGVPWLAGTLGLVNGFGCGVADDKLVHPYVEDLIRYFLGEEPIIRSVPTFDLERAGVLEMVLDRMAELVIKPRDGHGGEGVLIGPRAEPAEIEEARNAVRAAPGAWVAQELVLLSRHPTVCGRSLEPRHVDLRPFAFHTAAGIEVLPGGLTRVALEADSLVVNSSRNGGAKDTWVVDRR